MSHDRNIKWLNDKRILYRQDPISDIPTIETNQYKYYADGTYQCYHLFNITYRAFVTNIVLPIGS